MDSKTNTTTKFPNNENAIGSNSNVKVVVSSEANTIVSDDSESYDAGISFSCNQLDSSVASSSKTLATPHNTNFIPVIRFSNAGSPHSPSSDKFVEVNFKDTNLSVNSLNVSLIVH